MFFKNYQMKGKDKNKKLNVNLSEDNE